MKSIKLFSTVLITLAMLNSCSTVEKENAGRIDAPDVSGEKIITITAEQFMASGMKLGKVTSQLFSERIQSTGILDVPPQYKAAVSVYYGGTVRDVELLVGQTVKKGATLFMLENPDYVQMQQDYLTAKSSLTYLEAEYDRQKKLLGENISSRKKYLKAEADYLTVLSNYKALGKKLLLLNIEADKLTHDNIVTVSEVKAPIGGYITEVSITKGQYLSPNKVAVGIVNTDHMHLELNVFERDITKIKKEQPIRFRMPDNSLGYFEGKVFLVGQAVYSPDRAINVHGHLIDEAHEKYFIPGMYIEAEILVNEVRHPALPSDAAVNQEEAHYVLVKQKYENNTYSFTQRQVTIGKSNDGYTEILNADALGDNEILIKGVFDLIQ